MKKFMKFKAYLVTTIFTVSLFLSVYSVSAIAAGSAEPSTAKDSMLVAHYSFNGNLKDSSKNGNDGSQVGNITFENGVYGQGAKFDGTSYIEVADNDSLDLTKSFTMSVWIYKEPTVAGVPYLTKMKEENQTYYPYAMYDYDWLKPVVHVAYPDGAGNDASEQREPQQVQRLDIEKWTLLTSTYDGKSLKVFLNDQQVANEPVNKTLSASNQPLYIGFGDVMGQHYFKGIMDDLRIYNTALTNQDVQDLYKAALKSSESKEVVSPSDKLVAIYRFEGNENDLSGMDNNGKAVGGIKYVDGVAGKAAKFDGKSYIEVENSPSLQLDKSFTIGAWLYEEDVKYKNPVLYKPGSSTSADGMNPGKEVGFEIYDMGHGGLSLGISDFGNINVPNSAGIDTQTEKFQKVPVKKWYYYSATYDGKSLKLYINGSLIKTQPYNQKIAHSWGPLMIGGTTDSVFFKGMMDELRIYNYCMTPQQVAGLYHCIDGLSAAYSPDLKVNQTTKMTVKVQTYKFTTPNPGDKDGKNDWTASPASNVTFKSNSTKVATVTSSGDVKAVGAGKTTITVSSGRFSMNAPVTVTK